MLSNILDQQRLHILSIGHRMSIAGTFVNQAIAFADGRLKIFAPTKSSPWKPSLACAGF
jgi:hypothetical protein